MILSEILFFSKRCCNGVCLRTFRYQNRRMRWKKAVLEGHCRDDLSDLTYSSAQRKGRPGRPFKIESLNMATSPQKHTGTSIKRSQSNESRRSSHEVEGWISQSVCWIFKHASSIKWKNGKHGSNPKKRKAEKNEQQTMVLAITAIVLALC